MELNDFLTALGAGAGLGLLLLGILTAQTTDLIKAIAFNICLVGVVVFYIKFVIEKRIDNKVDVKKQEREKR